MNDSRFKLLLHRPCFHSNKSSLPFYSILACGKPANYCSWSIINQLGGKIHIRSEIGKGTDVEIMLPVDRPDGSEVGRLDDLAKISADAQEAITTLRARVTGKSVLIARCVQDTGPSRHKDVSWNCIERYCADWFGYQIVKSSNDINSTTADLIITDHDEEWANSNGEVSDGQRILIVHEHMACRQRHKQGQRVVGTICTPIGPFKLARCLLDLLDQDISQRPKASNTSDAGTQTPLAEERVPGVLMTDYGFTMPLLSPKSKPEGLLWAPVLEEKEPELPKENDYKAPEDKESQSPDHDTTPSMTKTQDDEIQTALANLGAMPLRMPTRFTKRIQTAPLLPTFHKENESKPAPLEPTNPLHILAVDDNALNLQLIHRYLMKRKIDTIITARNGVEAVAAVRDASNKGNHFDVIFMDISMPEMDGFEATRLIRSFERSFAHRSISEEVGYFANLGIGAGDNGVDVEGVDGRGRGGRTGRAYVIALTGLASRRDRDEAESSGFDEFLTKPIAFGKIGDLLRRLSAEKGGEFREPGE